MLISRKSCARQNCTGKEGCCCRFSCPFVLPCCFFEFSFRYTHITSKHYTVFIITQVLIIYLAKPITQKGINKTSLSVGLSPLYRKGSRNQNNFQITKHCSRSALLFGGATRKLGLAADEPRTGFGVLMFCSRTISAQTYLLFLRNFRRARSDRGRASPKRKTSPFGLVSLFGTC